MKFCDLEKLTSLCNRNIEDEFQKVKKILLDNGLNPSDVLNLLEDYTKGEDLAFDTINNITKRLFIILKMDDAKIHLNKESEDGWMIFGTIHSDKQRYELKKVDGDWFAKVKFDRGDIATNEETVAVKLGAEISKLLTIRLG